MSLNKVEINKKVSFILIITILLMIFNYHNNLYLNNQNIYQNIKGVSVNKYIKSLDLLDKKATGASITIAILDSGAISHPDYENRITKFVDVINNKSNTYDDFGHGTEVTGIIAGDGKASKGKFQGVAPNVKLIIIKVLDDMGQVNIKNFSNGLQWMIDNKKKYNINIACISFGFNDINNSGYCEIEKLIKIATEKGILVVSSAGNLGKGKNSITFPASLDNVISVGSFKYENGKKYISDFSSRDDSSCPTKPDVYTIGEDIITIDSKTILSTSIDSFEGYYTTVSGTSFSAALVAGEAARLMESHPNSNINEIALLIKDIYEMEKNDDK